MCTVLARGCTFQSTRVGLAAREDIIKGGEELILGAEFEFGVWIVFVLGGGFWGSGEVLVGYWFGGNTVGLVSYCRLENISAIKKTSENK